MDPEDMLPPHVLLLTLGGRDGNFYLYNIEESKSGVILDSPSFVHLAQARHRNCCQMVHVRR